MTTSIEDELEMLVAAERDRPGAGAESADRVFAGVVARLEGAPPPASVPGGTPWGLLSVVGGAVVVALAVGGWSYAQPAKSARFEPMPTPALAVVRDVPVIPELHAELEPEPAPEQEVEQAEAPTKPAARKNLGTVADELALIEEARTSLDRGQPKAALGVLRDHRKQFPKGAFLEEAAALRASALCDAGKTEAAAKASAAFLRRYPSSVHASRVKACSE